MLSTNGRVIVERGHPFGALPLQECCERPLAVQRMEQPSRTLCKHSRIDCVDPPALDSMQTGCKMRAGSRPSYCRQLRNEGVYGSGLCR
jgi:hypothetical protein